MTAKPLILILTLALVVFSQGSYFVPAQPAGSSVEAESGILGNDSFLAEDGGQSGFDLNSCQKACRERFGLEPQSETEEQFRGGSGRGSYYEYANCIAACNSQFWKDFDRKTRNLEQLR